jgi:hypothetical protein
MSTAAGDDDERRFPGITSQAHEPVVESGELQ